MCEHRKAVSAEALKEGNIPLFPKQDEWLIKLNALYGVKKAP